VDLGTGTVQWSEELHRIHGIDPSEFEGTLEAAVSFLHPDDRPATLRKPPVEAEFRIVRRDGEVRWLFSRGEEVRDARGAVVGMRGICQDVTDRHDAAEAIRVALERERAAAEQLRAADRVKDEFLATVSHELRTPLTTILGFAPLLLDPPPGVAVAEVVERIERNARDMLAMVERVLDFSRLTAGAVEVHPDVVGLDELVMALLDGFADAQVRLVSQDALARVAADREATRHILDNLLSNAVKFSPPGAPIEVTTATDGAFAVVAVADEGPGVPPELRERVFERFFRAAQPAGKRGAGVGLAIARRYAELQGGTLWCEGNVFRFTLPRA
jgi:PAS domain S-box-containing protein